MGAKWSDEADEYLVENWTRLDASASKLAVEMSRLFGVVLSRNAVIGRVHRMGLTNRVEYRRRGPALKEAQKPKRPRQWKLPPPSVPSILHSAPVPIEDLLPRQCRYVVTDKSPYLYCPASAVEGASYCQQHCCVVFARRVDSDKPGHDTVPQAVVDRPLHNGEAVQSGVGPRTRRHGGAIHLSFDYRVDRPRRRAR